MQKPMKRQLKLAVVCVLALSAAHAVDDNPAKARGTAPPDAGTAKTLSLSNDGRVLMTYNAQFIPSPDKNAPWYGRSGFIHPVRTPSGRVVTDDFPLDHMHQHGLMFAWTSAWFDDRPVDFWNSKKQAGHVEHVKTDRADADAIVVRLRHVDDRDAKPRVVLNETWALTRVPHASMNVFDLVSTQTCATTQPLDIRKYHYGAMCVRGPIHWKSGDVMLTSEGKGQADGNHSRPNWVAMFGTVNDAVCGIAAMGHPGNYRAPQPVRLHPKMPYLCFAPMVLGAFQLEPGKPYVSRFRFVAFDGEPDADQLNALWQHFVGKE